MAKPKPTGLSKKVSSIFSGISNLEDAEEKPVAPGAKQAKATSRPAPTEQAARVKTFASKRFSEWKDKIEKNPQTRPPNSVDLALLLISDKTFQIEDLGIDPEGLINETEIETLIAEITKKPRRSLFVHEPAKTSLWSSEIPIADRIVNIWEKSTFKN